MGSKVYPPVYLKTMTHAEKTGEMKFWRESRTLDGECARQIDQIIGNEDKHGAKSMETQRNELDALLDQYGNDRILFVLAETVDTLRNDSRLSESNKRWFEMQDFPHFSSALDTADFILQKRANPVLLNDFLNILQIRVYERAERAPTEAEPNEESHLDNPGEFYEMRKQYEKELLVELARTQKYGTETGFQMHIRADFDRSPYWFHVEIEEAITGLVRPYYFCCESLESLKKAVIWVVNETKFYEVTAFVKDRSNVTFRTQQDIDLDFDEYYHNFYRFAEDIRETYPDLLGRTFMDNQMKELYQSIIDKKEYPQFDGWLQDMRKSGLVYLCYKNYVSAQNKVRSAEELRNDEVNSNLISNTELSVERGR
ncbi:MAG: DUF3849 domain-containing protein [Clostridiales bacterium]|nr:DUF3849 domain-containing protein [Clostridiales bacterium]